MTSQDERKIGSIRDYFDQQFFSDSKLVCDEIREIIFPVLLPERSPARRDMQDRLRQLEHKEWFLFSLFYVALLDQAIHHMAHDFHCSFDQRYVPPKIYGILGGYGNASPDIILAIAALYEDAGEPDFDEQFSKLGNHCAIWYGDVFDQLKLPLDVRGVVARTVGYAIKGFNDRPTYTLGSHSLTESQIDRFQAWLNYLREEFVMKVCDT